MKKKLFSSTIVLVVFLLTGCVSVKQTTITNNDSTIPSREYSVQSVMWQQNASEYRALCYQAFNTAKMRLDIILANNTSPEKKLAIITDIDETVLDNSPYNARLIIDEEEYTREEWVNWGNKISANAIPGAKTFLNYAQSKGVEIFYISNRFTEQKETTIENLKKVGFPYADSAHVFLMLDNEGSSKQKRFENVAKNYTVVLFMGDNLGDFSANFSVNSTDKRNQLTDEVQTDFGVQFIVLPNPMYGDWETKGIYQGQHNLTEKQKRAIRKASLKSY